jgi:hypothetical protein
MPTVFLGAKTAWAPFGVADSMQLLAWAGRAPSRNTGNSIAVSIGSALGRVLAKAYPWDIAGRW